MQKVFLIVHFCALKDLKDRCHELLPLRFSISCPFTIIIVLDPWLNLIGIDMINLYLLLLLF